MRVQSTPVRRVLDFKALAKAPETPLPIWLRSFQRVRASFADRTAAKTTFRLQLDQLDNSDRDLLLRIFFDDWREDAITVSGRTEAGEEKFARGPFGAGLDLPSSETLIVPIKGIDFIVIETRGDGSNLRGVFMSWLDKSETRHALDFAQPPALTDPFDNSPSQYPPLDDLLLGGRIRATIDPGLAKLTPRTTPSETWEFDLAAPPFLAVLSFEILNADPLAPLEVLVNDHLLGPAAMRAPDLADPAYQSVVRPVDRGGTTPAGSLPKLSGVALRAGTNKVTCACPAHPALSRCGRSSYSSRRNGRVSITPSHLDSMKRSSLHRAGFTLWKSCSWCRHRAAHRHGYPLPSRLPRGGRTSPSGDTSSNTRPCC